MKSFVFFDDLIHAFLEEVVDVEKQDKIILELTSLREAFKSNSVVRQKIWYTTNSFTEQAKLVQKALQSIRFQTETIHLVCLLLRERSLQHLEGFIQRIHDLRERQGMAEHIVVHAPVALSLKEKKEIQGVLQAKRASHIFMTEHVEEELLGGIRLDGSNWRKDLSLQGHLSRLQHVLQQAL